MSVKKRPMARGSKIDLSKDDAPDLTSPEWAKKFARARVRRGRPKKAATKVSTTLRLDADVIDVFRADGPGWQGRMNAALRKAAKLKAG